MTSLKDMAKNTQETFDLVSSAGKTHLGYFCASYFIKNGQDF